MRKINKIKLSFIFFKNGFQALNLSQDLKTSTMSLHPPTDRRYQFYILQGRIRHSSTSHAALILFCDDEIEMNASADFMQFGDGAIDFQTGKNAEVTATLSPSLLVAALHLERKHFMKSLGRFTRNRLTV